MVSSDLHLHTRYSHGRDTPRAMYDAAVQKGLTCIGFSEHSPRPDGFDYTHEYRDKLKAHLDDYVGEVLALKSLEKEGGLRVLFGMEMDWLSGEEEFARKSAKAFDFDYLIGSVHFIDHWGFDDGRGPWETADEAQCFLWYKAYFNAWEAMLASGLYAIAAHPDLIKIFSVDCFHRWLAREENRALVGHCLDILGQNGMAMEISSAGLRKVCHEIYPCAEIMEMAAQRKLDITFASDAHTTDDIAFGFSELAQYATSFGFSSHVLFDHGQKTRFSLSGA